MLCTVVAEKFHVAVLSRKQHCSVAYFDYVTIHTICTSLL